MKTFAIYFAFLLLVACEKEEKESVIIQDQGLNSFPLNIGNEWEYSTEVTISDQSGSIMTLSENIEKWNVISDTLINGLLCTKVFQLDSNFNGAINQGNTFYSNQPDGLLGMAYESDGTTISFKSEQTILSSSNLDYISKRGSASDTVILPVIPFRLMKFPVVINEVWVSNENNINPNAVKRKWIGNEFVNTPAGTFYCFKLKMYWDVNNDLIPDSLEKIVTQYFSTKGLVKEETFQHLLFGGSNDISTLKKNTQLVRVNF